MRWQDVSNVFVLAHGEHHEHHPRRRRRCRCHNNNKTETNLKRLLTDDDANTVTVVADKALTSTAEGAKKFSFMLMCCV